MNVKAVLFYFFIGYSMLLLVAGFVLNLSELPLNSASNIPAFYAAFLWAVSVFVKKNHRWLNNTEKAAVAIGAILVSLGFQCLLGYTQILRITEFSLFFGEGHNAFSSEIFQSSKFAAFIFLYVVVAYGSLVATQKTLFKNGAAHG